MSGDRDSPALAAALNKSVAIWSEFERFLPGFAEAMDRRFYTPEWLRSQVWSGAIKFWSSANAAITAQLRAYPTGAIAVHGLYATGPLNEVLKLIPLAEAWGKKNCAVYAFVDSREAWQRLLEPYGYDAYKFSVLKEL